MRSLVVFAITGLTCSAALVVACGTFSGSNDSSTPAGDAATDATLDSASAADGDAGIPSGCVLYTLSSKALTEGSAQIANGPSGLTLTLTEDTGGSTGGLYFQVQSISSFDLQMNFQMTTDPGKSAGEGLSIAWLTSADNSLPPIGGSAEKLAFCPDNTTGPIGAAVMLEAFDKQMYTATSDGGACATTTAKTIAFASDAGDQPFQLSVSKSGSVVATVNGATYVGNVAPPSSLSPTWLAIAGSTGAAYSGITVDNLTLTICGSD